MKTNSSHRALIALTIWGAATFGLSGAALAKTAAEEQQDVEAAQKRVEEKKQEYDNPKSPIARVQAERELKEAEKELEREKAELKAAEEREAAEDNDNDRRTFTGKVLRTRGAKRFDLRASGKIYNVTTLSRLPSKLDKGDTVKVIGVLRNGNDITKAKVRVTKDR